MNFGQLLGDWPVHDMDMPIRVRTEAGDYDIAAAHQRTEDGVFLAILDLGEPLDGQQDLLTDMGWRAPK